MRGGVYRITETMTALDTAQSVWQWLERIFIY